MTDSNINLSEQSEPVAQKTDDQLVRELIERKLNTSQIIRYLGSMFLDKNGEADRSRIVKALKNGGATTKDGEHIRYQHVRNVLITPVKRS